VDHGVGVWVDLVLERGLLFDVGLFPEEFGGLLFIILELT
jgi:hypothetical protein